MVNEEPNIRKANNLEYITKKYSKRGCFTTADVADILQVSQQRVIELYDDGWFGNSKVPKGGHRRIDLNMLINSIKTKWSDSRKGYPQRLLLHLMEILDFDPIEYEIGGFAGRGGIRFHVQEDIYSSSKAADFMRVSLRTIIKCVDNGIIDGYRYPNSKFRRVPAGAIIRYARDNIIPLSESANELTSPDLITYPGNLGGAGREGVKWSDGGIAAYIADSQAVWYRSEGKVHEFSIRKEKDGLYVKYYDIEEGNPIIYFILLGKAGGCGINLGKDEASNKVNQFLAKGSSLLRTYFCRGDKDKILNVLKKVYDRFSAVYPQESYKIIWQEFR